MLRPFIETKSDEYAEIPFKILKGGNFIAEKEVLISSKGKSVKKPKTASSEESQNKLMDSIEGTLSDLTTLEYRFI
ncbi:MAG: hypothetical protein AAF433_21655 [Bacteroidota bacterium]